MGVNTANAYFIPYRLGRQDDEDEPLAAKMPLGCHSTSEKPPVPNGEYLAKRRKRHEISASPPASPAASTTTSVDERQLAVRGTAAVPRARTRASSSFSTTWRATGGVSCSVLTPERLAILQKNLISFAFQLPSVHPSHSSLCRGGTWPIDRAPMSRRAGRLAENGGCHRDRSPGVGNGEFASSPAAGARWHGAAEGAHRWWRASLSQRV
jgi:hypothetical protein